MPDKRSKKARGLAAFAIGVTGAAIVACGHKTDVTTRTVTLHAPLQCAPLPDDTRLFGQFLASGDFDPSVEVPQYLRATDVGAQLVGVPAATRSLVVDLGAGDLEWRGVRDIAPSGDVDLLLWPYVSPCALSTRLDPGTGITLGAINPTLALVVGGAAPDTPTRAWVVDLAVGSVTSMRDGLLTPREFATVTPFGDGALVAGGLRADDGTPLATAEVFVPALHDTGDFDRAPIALSGPRRGHGAIPLATGETVLVAGAGVTGLALRSLELIDPVSRTSRSQGLTQLEVARVNPTVVRLANGEILVAGGTDDQNMPVTRLEWLSPDAHHPARRSRDLVARKTRGFVALPGGGALAVIAPEAADVGFQSVWVISADGEPEAATPIDPPLTAVALFEGSEGRPVLWTGDRWLIWSPWTSVFLPLNVTPPAVPDFPLGPSGNAIASPDPGLALFLTIDDSRVTGLRFASRSAYATLVAPLLVDDLSFVAPDRLVAPGTTTSITFDAQLGLTLIAGATVSVTDLTFADFAIDLDVPTGEPPLVVLRDANGTETELGATACVLPETPGVAQTIHVERGGTSVQIGGRDCGVVLGKDARIAIAFRGASSNDNSVLRNVRIARR